MVAKRVDHSCVLKKLVVITLVLALCLTAAPAALGGKTAGAPATAGGGATFDLFSIFPKQMLSPATGRVSTWMPVDTRNITDSHSWVALRAVSESSCFTTSVSPSKVKPSGAHGVCTSRVTVRCATSTPEGTTGYIKVTGTRGAEQHRVWLKVTVLASQPQLARSPGPQLIGQGYSDPVLQAYTGKPLSWGLAATNQGGDRDTYALSYAADFPCDVRFLQGGAEINQVAVPGLTFNYLYANAVNFKVEIAPRVTLPENHPETVTLILGPGKNTGVVSKLHVQVVNPGLIYCANAADGLHPHAHQVMPCESTSFVCHVTNQGQSPATIQLSVSGPTGQWNARLDKETIKALAPGATADATLTVNSPKAASPGDRLDLTVSALSNLGASDQALVSTEITNQRNVYYWSVDSMDPEYLYLNSRGTGPGSPGDWLMPNMHAFTGQGANYTNAKVYLPSATDMNHTNALAGTYTGTQGIYMVGGTFRGFTQHDEVIDAPNSMDLMRCGASGAPIKRIFEVAKEQTGGKALTGFWSNKNWLADIEAQRSVDIEGSSETWPLFFPHPGKYNASDPQPSVTFSKGFYNDVTREVILPILRGQLNLLLGLGIFFVPVTTIIGTTPGNHADDRYLVNSFFRSIEEEDPDISYINAADLDNTGHFTGSSWDPSEFDSSSQSKYSPLMKRADALAICRKVDRYFGEFIDLLKARGVYDNSIIVVLSDHGMENLKDQSKGYQVIDLRNILRQHGFVHWEDYHEAGGTEINLLWCEDKTKLAAIKNILDNFTISDPELGSVKPLTVVDRKEMLKGKSFGVHGRVRPRELYSEYWINHPDEPAGHLWPDLFVFPLYNYNIAAHGQILAGSINPVGIQLGNMPDSMQIGFPAAHGGLQTTSIPLVFKAPAGYPGYKPGKEVGREVEVADIAPTIYSILGWSAPPNVDGKPLPR
jgi:Type I phosphodiesterase / nucleotide pyrophosphatase/NPCBM-associated, NEW3 domain of alpha-galactosidase